jgi:L-seryl-tRNA(Ser) seleniumtransferase
MPEGGMPGSGAGPGRSLRPVINATGVILHTNLGRAPLGRAVVEEIAEVAAGYSNLEFDLREARRGDRNVHVAEILRLLTGAEDALVVNNNAAGITLTLRTLAYGREVVVSRGELIEIGGSFRIPEIMAAAGARMVEVGTTNRTRLEDYERAIGPETALLFKAHKSNYSISGFAAEVPSAELAGLGRRRGVAFFYDLGSGLLRRPPGLPLEGEPDVAGALAGGADLVAFSCDKLVGGPQAGVVAGRTGLVAQLRRAPLMRALRVGKLTLAGLSAACRAYLRDESLERDNPTIAMLARSLSDLENLAAGLRAQIEGRGIAARVVDSAGQCGGGALPELSIPSRAVELVPREGIGDARVTFAERIYRRLLDGDPPVLAVLREGRLLLDVLTLSEAELPQAAQAVGTAVAVEAGE